MSGGVVTLPPGVGISPGRETSAIGVNNTAVPGMNFVLTLPNQATTTVFIPYAIMTDTAQVTQMFADRVNAVNGVTALGS